MTPFQRSRVSSATMQCRTGSMALLIFLAGFLNVLASEMTVSVEVSVVDLGYQNFTTELSQPKYKGSYILVEYYAHWCPHCQHYKPTYEKIGRYFNGSPRPEPLIWVARMDCAVKENYPVCDQFKVKGYPTLFLGKTEHFLEHKTDDLTRIVPKEAESVVSSVNSILGTSYVFEEKTTLMKVMPVQRERQEKQKHLDLDDIERATVELFDRLFQSHVILNSSKVRKGLIQWIDLLAEAHPSLRCRKSCHFMQKHMETIWPPSSEAPNPFISRFHICSVSYKEKEWGACAGSIPDRRGFTCGLWQLLHALSVGIEDHHARLWINGVRSFAEFFFGCEECAKHFLKALNKGEVEMVDSKEELVMWLWKTHNLVNARLSREESEGGTGDPVFPKVQWPPDSICPDCRTGKSLDDSVDWREQQVLQFLRKFYSAESSGNAAPNVNRKELRTETAAAVSTDVFDKADATALELSTAKSLDASTLMLVGVVVFIIIAVRRTRKRKIAPRKKDLL